MKPVLFETHKAAQDKVITVIKLNAPDSLNALTLEMIDLIQGHLDAVRENDRVVAVVLDSVIDKAFCAGGDVVGIVEAVKQGNTQLPQDFFRREYRLDLDIHHYPKPIICLANGIVMGGGMGLMNGCSHRVVTDTTYMSMPEISIGLFPDVGASWFLNRVPKRIGLFLGITAAPMNAADALYLGLADFMISSTLKQEVLELLISADWDLPAHNTVDVVLRNLQSRSREQCRAIESRVSQHKTFIDLVTDKNSISDIVEAIIDFQTDDPWLNRIRDNLLYGSPLSMCLIYCQLHRAFHMSLEEAFEFEYGLALACCEHREFSEGVRALLIDKDRQPEWTYKSIREVNEQVVGAFFA